jgi:hypothetical protein
MYNIQLRKTILAGIGLIVLNQVHVFARMCQDMGFLLVALGLSGAIGQVFMFMTIAKFGALTCAIIGLARKVAMLVASIYFYGHSLNRVQVAGLCLAIGAMVNNFFRKKGKGRGGTGMGTVVAVVAGRDLRSLRRPTGQVHPRRRNGIQCSPWWRRRRTRRVWTMVVLNRPLP